jgi:hypothetical protein
VQLIKDYEDYSEVNKQLDKMYVLLTGYAAPEYTITNTFSYHLLGDITLARD